MEFILLKIKWFLQISFMVVLFIFPLTKAEFLTHINLYGSNLAVTNLPVTTRTVIPVAFHIIKKTDGTGEISDQQIYDQIEILRYAFANSNFSFIVYSIDRTTNNLWSSATFNSDAEAEMKEAIAVDPTHTLNIYSCVLGTSTDISFSLGLFGIK